MFDLSWTELLVIAVVAILVVGPKDLPRALRAVGKYAGKAKRMARDFQNQFNEALRETELDTIKKDIDAVGKIDPMAGLRKDVGEIEANLTTGTKMAETPAGDAKLAGEAKPEGAATGTGVAPVASEETPPPDPVTPDAVANAKP